MRKQGHSGRGMHGNPVMRANPWLISPRLGYMRPLQRPGLPHTTLGNRIGLRGPVQYTPLQGNNLPGPMPAQTGQPLPQSNSQSNFPANPFPVDPLSAVVPPTPSLGGAAPINAVVNPQPAPPPPPAPAEAFQPSYRRERHRPVGPKDWSPRSGRCGCRHKR